MIADLMEFYGIWPHVCFTEVILKLSVLKQLGFVFVSVSILVFSCIFKITVDFCSKELGHFFFFQQLPLSQFHPAGCVH